MGIGIYMIQNMVNNKVYIGQSVDINRRWNDHKNKLKQNKHENIHLQDSFNKYGDLNFNFSILEECNVKDLNNLEIYYINKYKSYDPAYGYNLTYGGSSQLRFNDNTILKMQKAHEYEYVPIVQYSINKDFICRYDSLSSAARSVFGTPSGIKNCANTFSKNIGNSKTYKGFLWIYESDILKFENCDIETYLIKNLSYPVNQYKYPSGEFVKQYASVRDAAIDNNVSIDVISMCSRMVQKQSNGFTYRNANIIGNNNNIEININKKNRKTRKIIALDMITNEPVMEFNSMTDAKKFGYHTGHISECCNNKRKSYKGYFWKYFNENGIKETETKSFSDL